MGLIALIATHAIARVKQVCDSVYISSILHYGAALRELLGNLIGQWPSYGHSSARLTEFRAPEPRCCRETRPQAGGLLVAGNART